MSHVSEMQDVLSPLLCGGECLDWTGLDSRKWKGKRSCGDLECKDVGVSLQREGRVVLLLLYLARGVDRRC